MVLVKIIGYLKICILLVALLWSATLSITNIIYHDPNIIIAFDSILLFYFALYYPTLFAPWMSFSLGVFTDVLTAVPIIGLNGLLNIGCRAFVIDQAHLLQRKDFYIEWFGFSMMLLGLLVSRWFGHILTSRTIFYPEMLMLNWILTSSIYPLLRRLFNRII